ncbi:MAG: exonuclease SbcCD subunit D C-terminal domain-containing protein [Bacteroidales bacterium]|nr:exonuclease SbcCD subunit D C-terminal domain-containing protein [Bacteroidales bacterium]
MKIIHTADWHLGQSFYDYQRKDEHLHFLAWLQNVITEKKADLLLIAGDLFDSPNPSAESQKIFYRFLKNLNTDYPDIQVVIIAGNHDSAARLEAPNPLLEMMNIAIRGVVKKDENGDILIDNLIIPVTKSGETVAYVLAVPYLRQGDHPEAETYSEGVGKLYNLLFDNVKDTQKPVIAMGHLHATGSEISQNDRSERTVIGGLESISPDAFLPAICYTALGHLHRAQQVSKRENVRYAGAPVPMSFAEKHNKQGVMFVEINNDKTDIEKIMYDTPVKLLSVPPQPAPLADVLAAIAEITDGEVDGISPFLEIKVAISQPEPSLRHQIEEALKSKAVRLARIEAVVNQKNSKETNITFEELRTINPLDIAIDNYKKRFGGETMPNELQKLLLDVIREVEL